MTEWRETNGPFINGEQLMCVKGLCPKTGAVSKDLCCVENMKASGRQGSCEVARGEISEPKTCKELIEWREKNRPFINKEQLKCVKGLGLNTQQS